MVLLAALLLIQDKQPNFNQVMAKTQALKNYQWKITCDKEVITGTFDQGTMLQALSEAQAAGKGRLSIGNVGGGWSPLSSLLSGNTWLQRLVKIAPAHVLIVDLTRSFGSLSGDSFNGFVGTLNDKSVRELVKLPWINKTTFDRATKLQGTATVSVDYEGRAWKVELKFTGREADKDVSLSVTLEMSKFGGASIPDEIKKRISP